MRWTAAHGNQATEKRIRLQRNRRHKAYPAIAGVLNLAIHGFRVILGYLQLGKFVHLEISALGESFVVPALFVSSQFHGDMLIPADILYTVHLYTVQRD